MMKLPFPEISIFQMNNAGVRLTLAKSLSFKWSSFLVQGH